MSESLNSYTSFNETELSERSQSEAGPLVVLFVSVGLLLGGIFRQIHKKTMIPYTPMLLTLGMILGYFKDSLGILGQSTLIIEQLNPRMILLIFIPTLIFQSAFNCNWHVFRKSLLNILLLAGPGLLWNAILNGLAFKVVLFYSDEQLTWYQAITLGTILSATDPVAFKNLLKQFGASVRFNTLIEGQSLLNNGTAMVFFTLFLDLVKQNRENLAGNLTDFVRITFGGPLLGIIFGVVISYWIKGTLRDSILYINITFAASYLCFYVAEFTSLHVSGILSVVTLGLYMSAVGKRKIHPQSQHDVDNIWSYLQYVCKTLIFVLTGILLGLKDLSQSTITGWDWIRLFAFWPLLIIARAIMVFSFISIMQGSGYGINKKEIIVLIYGRLRGSLGLCLALIVGIDDSLPERFRQLTVFYMCGMAVLTTIINGFTCSKVIDYVEMIRYPEIKKKLYKRCVKQVLQSTQWKLNQIQQDPDLAFAKWKDVEQLTRVKKAEDRNNQSFISGLEINQGLNQSLLEMKKQEMLEEIRFRFTRYLKKIYLQLYKNGQISEEATQILTETCQVLNDKSQLQLNYFEILSSNFSMETVKYYLYFKGITFIGPFIIRMLVAKLYFVYQVTAIFIQACQKAENAFKNRFPLHNQELETVLEEVRGNKESALNYLTEMETNYPQVIQAVQTSRASTILLNYKKIKLENFHQQGFIDDKEFEELREEIDKDLINVHFNEFKMDQIRFNEVLTDCPLFANLNAEQLIKIRMKSVEILYEKDKKVIAKGESIKSVYVIVGGSAIEQYDDFYFIRVIGNILNPYDFTYDEPSKCIIKAKTDAKILKIESEIIEQLLEEVPQFKKKWYKNIFVYSVRHHSGFSAIRQKFTDKELRRIVEVADVQFLKQGDEKFVQLGGYVFKGEVQSQKTIYTKENLIPQSKNMKARGNVVLLKFNNVVGIEFKSQKRISIYDQQI